MKMYGQEYFQFVLAIQTKGYYHRILHHFNK